MTTQFDRTRSSQQQLTEKTIEVNGQNLVKTDAEIVDNIPNNRDAPKLRLPLWQRLSLRTKATSIAVALSTLPVILMGATAYHLTTKNIRQNVTQQQQARVIFLANKLDSFLLERFRDVQTLSQFSILNNRQIRRSTSNEYQQAVLEQYLKDNPGYDSIVVTNTAGDVTVKTAAKGITNYSNIDYFQQALKTNKAVIPPPRKSLATAEYSIFAAAPLIDQKSGVTIGVVRSRTPVRYINDILQTEAKELAQNISGFGSEEYLAVNDLGKIVIAPTQHLDYIGKDAQTVFPQAAARLRTTDTVGSVIDRDSNEQRNYLVSYTPIRQIPGQTDLNWGVIVAQPEAQVFAAQGGLLVTFLLATTAIALIIGAIAAFLVNRALRPVVNASTAVQKLGQGELDTRLAVNGEDEMGLLGANINSMADQLQTLLRKQEQLAEQAQLFADVTFRIRRSLNIEDILKTSVKEVRKVLQTDRVVIYKFNPDYSGTVVAESVTPSFPQALAETIDDPCFKERHIQQYKSGRVRAIDNIYEADLTDCHIHTLERFAVKANLVAPIIKDNQLLGLLIAHQCSEPRAWQQVEIDLFTQLAIQIGFALDQANLLQQVEKARAVAEIVSQQQRQQKEALQRQIVQLLSNVEEVAKGNLTVRAEVTAGELGTVAEFFNTIIESLRRLVSSVKIAAAQVNVAVGENKNEMQQLADVALNQAQEISSTLDSLKQMTRSIQAVADSAHQAAEVSRTAGIAAQVGGMAMNRTVESIVDLRQIVAQTANKVKNLSESSQQISKVVSLINQIALQTNVLAINATIEANRAGEEGKGFALVAEEIGELATKSSTATKEVQQIVENIQTEISEAVTAMEWGTMQVIEGTHFVEDTKKSLKEIIDVARQIDQLVHTITQATKSQVQTSNTVTDLIQKIAQISESTATSSHQVSNSLQQTLGVAQQLQASVGAFKVNGE